MYCLKLEFGGCRSHTEHEVWQIHPIVALSRIVIGQDLVVHEVDAKGIRNDDNDALGSSALWRLGDIGFEAMKLGHSARWCAIMLVANEAVRTRHAELRFPCL